VTVVAVLGPGAVGGTLAVRLASAGRDVVCVARSGTAARIRAEGLTLQAPDGSQRARPDAVERLEHPVDVLVVTVKAPALHDAVGRIAAEPATVVPLLNGIEHLVTLRERFPRVVAGSVSRFEAWKLDPITIRQTTPALVLGLAADVPALHVPGVTVTVGPGDRELLWSKAVRLGPLAAATSASGLAVGALRDDAAWRARLSDAIDEAAAVAGADGVRLDAAAQWEIIDAMAPSLTTSTARAVAAGRPSELDAVAGSIVRAGRRLGVRTPILERLLAECRAS
jgi:2-dehydropantoate 2-reductase